MTLPIPTAKAILRARLGEPVKDIQYVFGFRTNDGRAIALHAAQQQARLWYQPPEAPNLPGVRRIASAKNADLNGPLAALAGSSTPRVEIADADALHRFLDWYLARQREGQPTTRLLGNERQSFGQAYAHFQELMTAKSGHPFTGFEEGLAAVWESYKPRLRDHARNLLQIEHWSAADIGSGSILARVIEAIEIDDKPRNLTNNLVFWQNRYGHANRDHRILLEAVENARLRREVEAEMFALYVGKEDEGAIFERLSELSGGKYPLLAYLFFLKDMDRFMPIQPTGFDRAFSALGMTFSTLRQCNWSNYTTFNKTLDALRAPIADVTGLRVVRLVDAHSFCWIFATLLKLEAEGEIADGPGARDDGRVLGRRETSIIAMRLSVENTVRNANGQIVQRTLKNKELRMSTSELEAALATLLDVQRNRCALTGIPFQFHGPGADKNLLPSLDRINSDGHYEDGNLQVVCQFVNFWKSDSDNDVFKKLLMLVRGVEAD
jgi:hypothetical protein